VTTARPLDDRQLSGWESSAEAAQEGDLHRAWAEAEEHQQAARKALIRLSKLAR
jgi:hypothetical protein